MADAIIEGIRDRVAVAIKVNQSVGIQVPENRHNDLLEALFNTMSSTDDIWNFVAISNTLASRDYLIIAPMSKAQPCLKK